VNDSVHLFFQVFIYALIAAVIARALLSWFPISAGNSFARLIYNVTEPLIAPVRRILPRTGMFDFSAMLVVILLYVMLIVVNRAADQ
jgi:YggT family protein